ncbi:RodZ domain-containing protein [Aestuariirhabdus litorea]|uniref:Helix-turn-helix domain-containing protein n=1 Tax=Aestuariirhabdus litorea TaxID=2528527 RepID=A0A3P3VRI5_9GAMM|nr:helix-turn-helix domain-containing protein [Aestuariirhabdus litorea]RRJ83423.1 helix-turn-helix domain-containing protein [Aestuariirhabdus litorea]RWW93584.1 DUF4115 domain-containing protein [Endozoicomonadaceae bacterium GTF-13]
MTDESLKDDSVDESVDAASEVIGPTPGDLLVAAREKLGLTEEMVADRLKVTVDYVRALDSCAYDRLPGLTFTRGYIRGYAHLVELDPAEMIRQFDAFVGEQTPSYNSATVPLRPIKPPTSSGLRWISWLLFAALVLASIYWWQSQQGPQTAEVSEPGSVVIATETLTPAAVEVVSERVEIIELANTEPVAEQPPLPLTQDPVLSLEVVEESEVIVVDPLETAVLVTGEGQPSEGGEPVTLEEASAAVAGSEAATGTLLAIDFNAECWVEVRGESGTVMVASLRSSDSPVSIRVNEPVRILLGNVDAVARFEYDGAPVPLSDYTRGNIANLRLGSE